MTQLRLTLLGAFDLAAGDGHAVRIDMRKARALLAILVMARGQPMRREQLAGLLWSRGETRQTLASLSQALYSLRRALEDTAPDVIAAGTDTVVIDAGQLSVDVWEIEAAAAAESADGRRRCIDLYGGEFLDELSIDTEEGYSEWRAAERARIEDLVAGAGSALMTAWETAPEAADMTTVDRLLSIDPYNEPAIRVRMMLLARDGRQAAAIEAGDAFSELLSSELGIAPSDELADLSARIGAGGVAPASRRTAAVARQSLTAKLAIAAVVCVGA